MNVDSLLRRRNILKSFLAVPFFIVPSRTVASPILAKPESVAPPPVKYYDIDEFHVAGFQFHDGENVIDDIRPGERFTLRPEPDNPYDSRAVEILRGPDKLGYVPRKYNRHIFRLLRQGARLHAEAMTVHPDEDPWRMLEVRIRLESV